MKTDPRISWIIIALLHGIDSLRVLNDNRADYHSYEYLARQYMFAKDHALQGTIKATWDDVRSVIQKVEPEFAKHVDTISPDKSFTIYLAYYPYGSVEADTESSLFPNEHGGFFRLTDSNAPKDIVRDLGYSINSAPLGMVLDKVLEVYIDMKQQGITIPWLIYTPGMFFPFSSVLSAKGKRIYAPNGILSSSAGVRSTFMLPNIGCATNHTNIQRSLGVRIPTPKSLYEHWSVFKAITRNSDWRCCVAYFSEKWVRNLHEDKRWVELKQYLHEQAWNHFEFERNRIFYDMTFSMIQRKRNLRPNPYLADTASHLFATAAGSAPGFAPALDNESLPLYDIQKTYIEIYNLKKYTPTVMAPKHYLWETMQSPIYYSMQNPTTYISSPTSRQLMNTSFEMRELEYIMRVYTEELSHTSAPCNDTILGDIAKNIAFDYFHSKEDNHGIIKMTGEIPKIDKSFNKISNQLNYSNNTFSTDAPFLRGCISIRNVNANKQT